LMSDIISILFNGDDDVEADNEPKDLLGCN